MNTRLYIFSCLITLLLSPGCIHTSKITKLYNNGAQLKATDVVLFTGFNRAHSRTSQSMMDQTQRILKKYGVKAHYLHTTDFNYEFVKAGFLSTSVDIENPKFLYNMREVYGLTYVFEVRHISQYQGETMAVSESEKLLDESGVVFEVYSATEDEVIASMHLSGNTIHFASINEPEDRSYGNIHKNYGKGLRKLMKASKY